MKKLTKLLAVILSVFMLAGALCACGGDESDYVATTDGKSFTHWTMVDPSAGTTLSGYEEMLFYQEM